MSGAPTAQIWQTVSQCPSGALSCVYNHDIRVIFDEERQCSLALDGDKEIGECCYETDAGDGRTNEAVSGSGSADEPAGGENHTAAWTIVHTGVRPEYEGKGIAKRLVYKVTEEAEKRKIAVIPVCSYAAKVLK